ncbi:hypothetical protein GCM10027277_58000 [Pseudoduganella ginsengisoli]|uniref:Type 4 secretion system PilS N-terminal domain-containing protein n=1 Tax=Pseudoduganella ginsengisoli TaxID=1462440 RepID=A0A6L6Q9I1_9BURK|nr:type 4 pilus major pilin [Pseudoduganella ginsengisoli]MTW05892.1 hypothetical protein [Pseudoduganella ginsengisoli]
MIHPKNIKNHVRIMREAMEKREYRKLAQTGAVLTMDMLLWGGGVLSAMAFVLYMKNSGWPTIQGWMEASAISSNMKKMNDIFSGAAGYTGLANANVANTTIFQSRYLPGSGVINNRFGGTVTVGFVTTNTTADTMTYSETGVPSAACYTLANQLADDVDRVSVGGVVVKAMNAALVPTTLNTQCNSAATVTVLAEKIKQS